MTDLERELLSVRRRGVHTPPVARTFFWVQLVHFHACTHVWLKAHEKGLLHAHVVSLHLAFSTLIFHQSSALSSDNLFYTAFQSLTFTDLLPGLSRPKTRGPAHFRNGEEDFGYMANIPHSTRGLCPIWCFLHSRLLGCLCWHGDQLTKRLF